MSTPFLMWYDDRPKVAINAKIADVLAAFNQRFGVAADVALISNDDLPLSVPLSFDGVTVRIVQTVRRHNVWVAREASDG